MSQPFTFRCLGRPVLIAPDGTEVRLKVRKHLALLAYLALEPRQPWRRDTLTDLLWPRAPLEDARHSLATGVSMLRTILGPRAIETGRDKVRFATGDLVTDLARLEAGHILGDEFTPPLELGDLLQDLHVPDAPPFDHWKDRLRARWRPTIQAALVALLDRARRVGDWRELDRLADRLFELEDLSEQGMRAKMEAAALAGDRVGALKLYEQWQVRLREELSAAPSPVMQRFATHLRGGGLSGDPARPLPSRAASPEPFVGREAEYQVLYEVWEEVLERRPRHALVRGEAGTGKTSLVARLLSAAALNGAAVARVRCYELEREIPYAAIIALCRGLLNRPGAAATPPEALADLGQILPAVRARFDGLPAPVAAQGESARLRFTEAAFQLITAVAEEQPVALAVDDYHLADDVSLAVLHLILRRLEDQRVMMVFAGRAEEASLSPNTTRLLDAAAEIGVRVVDLAPLGDEQSEEALALLLGRGRPDVAVRRAILRAARGYPLVLSLLARDWEARGESGGTLQLAGMTPDPGAVEPQDCFGPLLDRVLLRLDAAARPVLDLAAVLGGRMNDLRFYALLGAPSAQTLGALSILMDHRVLRDGGAGLEFVNEVMRAQVYLRLPGAIRRQLHAIVADELLVSDQEPGEVTGLELAWHLMRCGRTIEAAGYLLRGAREAIDHGAAWEAERAIVTGEPELQGVQVSDGKLLLVEAIQEQGRFSESRLVLAGFDPGDTEDRQLLAQVFEETATRHHPPPSLSTMLESFGRLLAIADRGRSGRAAIIAVCGAAYLLSLLQDTSCCSRLLDATNKLLPLPPDPSDAARLLQARAMAFYNSRRLDECVNELVNGLTLLSSAGLRNTTLVELHAGLGVVACARGAYEDAEVHLSKAHDLAVAIGNYTVAACLAGNLGLCALRCGRLPTALEWFNRALRPRQGIERTTLRVVYVVNQAIVQALLGQHQAAYDSIAEGEQTVSNQTIEWIRQYWLLGKADVLWLLDRRGEAEATARRAVSGDLGNARSNYTLGPYARWTSRIASRGDLASIVEHAQKLAVDVASVDQMDRVQLLAAKLVLERRGALLEERNPNLAVLDLESQLAQQLASIPPFACTFLEKLGAFEMPKPRGASRRSRRRMKCAEMPSEGPKGSQALDPDSPS
jgi:DNA-binding SARP family transcriptional activator/tetratricopeptide (TPR) repeat protein